jgi:hypothetical protein
MKIKLAMVLPIVALLLPSSLLAQQSAEAAEQQNESEKPYEVVIIGKVTRAYLRELIVDVEEDFFAKYSELNDDDAYDMYCYEYTPTMSHIKKRTCEPLFMTRRRAENGADVAFSLAGGGTFGPRHRSGGLGATYLESPNEMRKNQGRHYEILIQKLEELTRTNKELGEIANVMEQLKYRLENY